MKINVLIFKSIRFGKPYGFSLLQAVVLLLLTSARVLGQNNSVSAWGTNTKGECNVPLGLISKAVVGGIAHTVALKNDGTVVAWGDNMYGQCSVPAGLTGVKDIKAGFYHTVVLKNDGSIVAWGNNENGQCNVP